MTDSISRRDALKTIAMFCGAAGAIGEAVTARADGLPHLATNDPQAVALGYTDNAKAVDTKANPNYQAGSSCSNCMQLQGKAGDAFRPCNIFAGKLVNANGWCKVWVKKA